MRREREKKRKELCIRKRKKEKDPLTRLVVSLARLLFAANPSERNCSFMHKTKTLRMPLQYVNVRIGKLVE